MTNVINKVRVFLNNKQWSLFIITFLLHEIFVLLLNTGVITIATSISDNLSYFNYASQISSFLHLGTYTFGAVYASHWYPLFVGCLYFLFGSSVIIGASFNAILIACSAVLFYNLVISFNKNIDKNIAFWVSFFVMNGYASLMYHSSLLLKEAFIIFLILAIFNFIGKIIDEDKFNWLYFFVILFLLILLINLRFFIGYALLISFFVGWFLNNKFTFFQKLIYGFLMVFIIFMANFFIEENNIGKIFKSPNIIQIVGLKSISNSRVDYFIGGATTTNIDIFKKDINSNKYKVRVNGAIESFTNIFLGPFPWQLTIKKYLLVIPDVIFCYGVLILSIIGILKSKIKSSLPYLISILIIIMSLVLGVDNLGASMRYKIPVIVLLSIFIPTGVSFLINYYFKK